MSERNINIIIAGKKCPHCKAEEIGLVKVQVGKTEYEIKMVCRVCGYRI